MELRIARLFPTVPLLVALLFAIPACETQTTTVSDTPRGGERVSPRVGLEAPTDLHDISGYLLRYRVTHRRMPETLTHLRTAEIMPAEGYPGLADYAYQPNGLGVLPDGRAVILVDTEVRVEDHAWCILAEPSGTPRTAALSVTLVPMSQLQAAARRSP